MDTITVSLRIISIILFAAAAVVLISAKRLPEVSEWLLAAIWVLLLIGA